ncbi:hypothetical protein DP144_01780 [Clostridium tetani]|nr:hypothetical protein DP144_01780 [Clostridium tetani]
MPQYNVPSLIFLYKIILTFTIIIILHPCKFIDKHVFNYRGNLILDKGIAPGATVFISLCKSIKSSANYKRNMRVLFNKG